MVPHEVYFLLVVKKLYIDTGCSEHYSFFCWKSLENILIHFLSDAKKWLGGCIRRVDLYMVENLGTLQDEWLLDAGFFHLSNCAFSTFRKFL